MYLSKYIKSGKLNPIGLFNRFFNINKPWIYLEKCFQGLHKTL